MTQYRIIDAKVEDGQISLTIIVGDFDKEIGAKAVIEAPITAPDIFESAIKHINELKANFEKSMDAEAS